MIIVVIGMLALLGMAGLALDMGMAYIAKSRLQNAVDAAALGGARLLLQTDSTTQAQAAALADFSANMSPTGLTITVEFSPTLVPFTGGANPRYIRVTVTDLPVAIRLARVLPGVGDSLDVGASAVAGPFPIGGTLCSALPVAICSGPNTAPGADNDSDCSNGGCFGYAAGTTDELHLKGDNVSLGPGNYGLVELGCGPGAACVRRGMAGGENLCFSTSGTIPTKPGVNSGPTAQGLNTRFGIYNGPVNQTDYPPDVVTRSLPLVSLYHDGYQALLALGPSAWDYQSPPGRPLRRVAIAPVIDCSTPINGAQNVPLIGGACVFLTRPVEGSGANAGDIWVQLLSDCEADGSMPANPDPNSAFNKIMLFRNWDSPQS